MIKTEKNTRKKPFENEKKSTTIKRERERERESYKLKFEISELEKLPDKTAEQEQELQRKREKLTRLEAQIASEKQFNWTPWIGLGITYIIIAGISIYLLVKRKKVKEK